MILLVGTLIGAVTWCLLTGSISIGALVFGGLLGGAATAIVAPIVGRPGVLDGPRHVLALVAVVLWDLIRSSWRVAVDVLTPEHRSTPRVIAVPLQAHTDFGLLVIANAVSLTPGTLSLDLSADRRVLYVHVLFGADPDAVRRDIHERLERRVTELEDSAPDSMGEVAG